MIETALISALSRADETIFGRPLLERLLLLCGRVGIRRFIVETGSEQHESTAVALGSFRHSPQVILVDSFAEALDPQFKLDRSTPCIVLSGNLVLAGSQLRRALDDYSARPGRNLRVVSTDGEHGGTIAIGLLGALLNPTPDDPPVTIAATGALPFALNGRPEDREEASDLEPRLVQAADFIGQLGDPLYSRKANALYWEFEEIGTNRQLGYSSPADIVEKYPAFFWDSVSTHLDDGIKYLNMTASGRQWIANLHHHVLCAERAQRLMGPQA